MPPVSGTPIVASVLPTIVTSKALSVSRHSQVFSPNRMLAVNETPFSIVAPALAKDISIKVLAVITIFVVIPIIVHYASPTRLTDMLVDAMSKAETASVEAFRAGHLSRSQKTNLKREVSVIRRETLRNSRSYRRSLWGFVKGRTFTVLLCIRKVRNFETELENLGCIAYSARRCGAPPYYMHSGGSEKAKNQQGQQ
ncbi:hypothetical protein DFH06DRAFT_1133318 [Mycena polygramma]|nr:hypothetical protein DFH06DRAFT_1133318 [Mycena polygramma]